MGTGGAEGVPGMFSDSRVSEHARRFGGKDVRTRCAALIDDSIKIDLGPDSYMQCMRDHIQPRNWEAVLFTHSDDDHFCIQELQYAVHPFTANEFSPFIIYGNEEVNRQIGARYPDWPFDLKITESFHPFCVGSLQITPIKARHHPTEECQNFIFEGDGSQFLYANDTGVWFEETWAFLANYRLDGMVLECNDGFTESRYEGHLNAEGFLKVIARLREMKIISDRTRVVTTHHSCRGNATHQELVDYFSPYRVEVGYDGMSFDVGSS